MILQRFYNDGLAQASWLAGCGATGEAIVIDPNRDLDQYVRAAEAEQLRITHVTETHIHADFVSGARALAERTGARLLLSGEGDEAWGYRLPPHAYGALRDGDVVRIGNLRLDVMHTPGHTPEHLSFLLTDTAAADAPMGMFTGDFLFAGDVGRPDLLERTAQAHGTMERMARALHASLRRLDALPDWLQLWPGHGAGSACGKSLGAVPSTTLGYERRFNWAFGAADEEAFVAEVLAGQPEPPPYFAVMKRVNRDGAGPTSPSLPEAAGPDRLEALLRGGAFVIDTRPTAAFAAGHVPGTVAIPAGRSFLGYAGTVVPYDRDVAIIVPDAGSSAGAMDVVRQLGLIGVDRVVAWCGPDLIAAWRNSGREIGTLRLVSPAIAADGTARIVDVRGATEWAGGHVAGSTHLWLGDLAFAAPPPGAEPLVLVCQTGSRSVIAASLLRARGRSDVASLAGGIDAWRAAGRPLERT